MSAQPVAIRRYQGEFIGIEWTDGNKSVFPSRWLRGRCPCAQCVDEWTGVRRVGEAEVPFNVEPKVIRSVGRYAICIEWNDSHDTGIYGYEYLRQLSQEYAAGPKNGAAEPACGSKGGCVPD